MRIHRVYLMSVLTDTYGDIPCMDAGKGFTEGISNPKYDKQEDIYNFFFDELAACVEQLGKGTDRIGGDVTSMSGDAAAWRKYANTLRLRFAMRISDVNPTKAKEEFEKALSADGGYIKTAAEDAYINGILTSGALTANAKEAINTQAWILHMMNPAEGWANLRRSDYPVLQDRTKLGKFESDFTYDDSNMQTPTRLRYPILEAQYNSDNYEDALNRMDDSDDWHHRVWWDKSDINVK